jgi:hypothetical protein
MSPVAPEIITAVAVFSGTVAGGIITHLSSRGLRDREWRLALRRERLQAREALYVSYLSIAQSHVVKAIGFQRIEHVSDLNGLNDALARIEMVASAEVLNSAKALFQGVLDSQSAGKKTDIDFYKAKQSYVQAVRNELSSLESV